MNRLFLMTLLSLLIKLPAYGEDHSPLIDFKAEKLKKELRSSFDHTHSSFDSFLKSYVLIIGSKSTVNYSAIKENPHKLKEYISLINKVSETQFSSFSEKEKLAFLINAYNALTITLVVNHYPVKSIKDIGGWFSSPWKMDFFTLFGEMHTLDDIEHEMIRKWFDEPRIHFALVCAAKSCPPLRNEAFAANKLDAQLEDAAKNFITDKDRNYFNSKENSVFLSSIFKWYGSDFNTKYGSDLKFISKYLFAETNGQKTFPGEKVNVYYLNYDWSLNDYGK